MARSSCAEIAAVLVFLAVCSGGASPGAESQTVRCAGTVVNAHGLPVSGAAVTTCEMLSDDGAGSLRVEKSGEIVTADDGAFAFSTMPKPTPSGPFIQTYVVASKEGLAPGWAIWNAREDLKVTLVLGEPAGAEGVVVDEAGQPIADARVLANLQRTCRTATGDEKKEWLSGLALPVCLETRTLVFFCSKDNSMGGEIARLDDKGYFRVDLSAEQAQKLQSGQAWFDVLIPIRKDASESGYRWKRESIMSAGLLARDKAQAGVARIEGSLRGPVALVGKALPPLDPFGLGDVRERTEGKIVLVCFFDRDQRPSRNCLASLAEQAGGLRHKGVSLVLVHAAPADGIALERWLEEWNIDVPAGSMEADAEEVRWAWGVKSLPWLILTDEKRTVVAEGFAIEELNAKMKSHAGGN